MRKQIVVILVLSGFCSSYSVKLENKNVKETPGIINFQPKWQGSDPYLFQGMTKNEWPNIEIDSSEIINSIWNKCLKIRSSIITDKGFLVQHALSIFEKSKQFRNLRPLNYKGFRGPWIEQRWIAAFEKIPFQKFAPWVPLFIQWTDYGARRGLKGQNPKYLYLKHWIKSNLRKDVLYITVVQNDEGIGEELQRGFRNILTISSGGYGYAKIPLFLLQQNPLPLLQENLFLLSFTGSLNTHRIRRTCNTHLKKIFQKKYKAYEGKEWINVVNNSKFVVCPRGFGRTAFKLYETFDLQRVPIYVYDDIPWLPYARTINWESIAVTISVKKVHNLKKILDEIDQFKYVEMIERAKEFHKDYFTFSGVLEKIGEFIGQPWSANISCDILPNKVR